MLQRIHPGTVTGVVPVWRRTADNPSLRKRLLVTVEYETPDGPIRARCVAPPGLHATVGDEVHVRVDDNGDIALSLPAAHGMARPARAPADVKGAVLLLVGIVAMALLVAGAVWGSVNLNKDKFKPPPFPSPPATPSVTPSGMPTGSGSPPVPGPSR